MDRDTALAAERAAYEAAPNLPIVIRIRRNVDGEIREYRKDYRLTSEDWRDVLDFMWSEGNYSCDCNRFLFFERAAGGDPDGLEPGCACNVETPGRYTVLSITGPDGEVLYRDSAAKGGGA